MKKLLALPFLLCCLFSHFLSAQCGANESQIVIEILTDNFPAEISWTLSDLEGTLVAEVAQQTYNINQTVFMDTVCATANACLIFTINDQYGDGICCGSGNGYFNIYVNGEVVVQESGDYGQGTSVSVDCGIGQACNSAFVLEEYGLQTAPMTDTWYVFTPDTTGQYAINTCELENECNTSIWIYDYCTGLQWDDSPEGGIYFAGNGCSTDSTAALLNANLTANVTYYIRIGSEGDCNSAIEWQINYSGPAVGCIDETACNYDPFATIMAENSCIYPGDPECPEGPDLIVLADVLQNSLYMEYFDNDDPCFISEGCMAGFGQREVIRFTTQIENIGEQDFYVGEPPQSPEDASNQWEWDQCHQHWHFEGYAEYILYDENQQPLPVGFKNGFCVTDLDCSFGGGIPKYSCSNQGISVNCGDIYDSALKCQWIDVTDVPDATYILVVRINWDQSPDAIGRNEKDYLNNWAQACINIYHDQNGNRSVDVFSDCELYVDCAGTIYGDKVNDCTGECGGTVRQGDINSDSLLNNNDLTAYVDEILNDNANELVTPCLDLNADSTINVTDVVLMLNCAAQETEPSGVDFCQFPYAITNILDTVSIKLGEVRVEEQFFDIEMHNQSKVVAFQFLLDGVTIEDIEPMSEVFGDLSFYFEHNEQEIIAVSDDFTPLEKQEDYYPILRVYYSGEQTTDSEVCIGTITSIVNDLREETITQINATCQSLAPWITGVDEMGLHNLQVSPNPLTDFTVFKFDEERSGILKLTDINGRIIQSFEFKNQSAVELKRQNMVTGLYLYQLKGTNFNHTGKIVVE